MSPNLAALAALPVLTCLSSPPGCLQVRVGVVWQLALPEDAPLMRLAGDQRWLAQARLLPAAVQDW